MGYFDRKGEVPTVEQVSDDVRGFLAGLRDRGNSRVAGLTLETLSDPLAMSELQWQIFMDRCKLSKLTQREMAAKRKRRLAAFKTPRGKQHYKYKRRKKREKMEKYRRKLGKRLPSELLYRLKQRAKKLNCKLSVTDAQFYDKIYSDEWNTSKDIRVSFQLRDKSVKEFSLENLIVAVDGVEVYSGC